MEYVNVLLEKPTYAPKGYRNILTEFHPYDSASYYNVLNRLEQLGPKNNPAFQIRLLYLKAEGVTKTQTKRIAQLESIIESIGKFAKASGDPYVVAQSKWFTALISNTYSNYVSAMVNGLEAIEILEMYLPRELLYDHYYFLSQLSFVIQDYDNSILYAELALENDKGMDTINKVFQARFINAIGQCYMRKNLLDRASAYFNLSRQQSVNFKSDIWIGINDCFVGQVQLLSRQIPEAKTSFFSSIRKSIDIDENIAAHAHSWLGRAYWMEGKHDSANLYFKAAEELLGKPKFKDKTQAKYYLTDLYLFKSDLLKTLGDKVQGDLYFSKFKHLNDSLKTTSVLSSKNIALLRLENEKSRLALQLVETDRKGILFRTRIIMATLISIFVVLLGGIYMHHNKLKLEKKIAVSEADKLIADKAFSVRQLALLKKSLMEKTELINQFEDKLKEINENVAVHDDLEKINKLKIVTEEGWKEFKDLFDNIHPGYRMRLKSKAPEITPAELRLATLIKLQYSSKEMAGVLGVSTDSIYKTRYRLRTRLNLPAEKSLETFLETEI